MLFWRSISRHGLISFIIGAVLLIAIALPALAVSSSARAEAVGKIHRWVIDHTANGQSAEFLVVLADQADVSGAAKLITKQEKGRYVYTALYKKAQETQRPIVQWLTDRGVEFRAYYIVNLIWVRGDRETALALASRSDVARLEGNPHVRSIPEPTTGPEPIAPNSPAAVELGITYTKAPEVWAMGYTGQGIVVGGQDTGIQWDHPALKTHYRGWNSATANHDYNWHDSIHTNTHGTNPCGVDSLAPCDDHGHGTHTIGTAVGDDGSSNQIGMAPGATFIGCRNMDNGYGTPATYLECFEFFLAPYPVGGTSSQGNSDLAPDVTNNSWGCPPSEGCAVNSLLLAVQAQRAAGIMTVVSAGNSGPACSTTSDPPSYHDEVYTVGNISASTGTISGSSSRGPATNDGSGRLKPDITAPGTGVRSAYPTNSYASLSGTSMASPHVAGAVALLWSARPVLKNNIEQTEQLLNQAAVHVNNSTCDTAGTTWPNNTYGYGRLNIKAAVDLVPTSNSYLTGVVRNSITAVPIAGAQVTATASLTMTASTTTGATGVYSLPLYSGTYTVSAAAYGYQSTVITGVNVVSGTTTTQPISLTAVTFYTVSGTVKDALTDLPLTATLVITDDPASPIATNAAGQYAVALAEGVTYTFGVKANVGGYSSIVRAVGPLTSNRVEDFNLAPDLIACTAPGYSLVGVSETFSAAITPTNWTVSSTVPNISWRFNNPGNKQNFTGGAGNFASADSDYFGAGNIMSTELRTPAMNLSSLMTVTLNFKTDFNYYAGGSAEVADVDVSVNGASGPWTNVWRKTAAYRGPHTETIDVSALAAGQSNVMVRFFYRNAIYDGWWQIDDVQLGYCLAPNHSHPGLTPQAASRSGMAGTTVVYQLEMQNISTAAMTYTLGANSVWPVDLSLSSLTMSANTTATLDVSVTIPLTVTAGQSDMATITMQGSNGSAQSNLTTTVQWPYAIYLPLISLAE